MFDDAGFRFYREAVRHKEIPKSDRRDCIGAVNVHLSSQKTTMPDFKIVQLEIDNEWYYVRRERLESRQSTPAAAIGVNVSSSTFDSERQQRKTHPHG